MADVRSRKASEPSPAADLRDTFARHDEQVARTLGSGSSTDIKRLYVDLAHDLERVLGDDEQPPVLAYPETAPVVAALSAGTEGLHLDAGCGPNPVAAILLGSTHGRLIVGMDIGGAMVRMARRVATAAGVDFLGVVGDVERLPFRDGVFGSVSCDDTIEHLPEDAAGLAELARVTRAGGRIVLATPNRRRLDVLLTRVRDRLRGHRHPPQHYYAAKSHLREYTWGELERLASPWVRVVGRGAVPWDGGWKHRVASRVTRLPLGRRIGRVVLLVLEPR